MTSSYPDWAWLHQDLLFLIREYLDQFLDYIRFSAVCKQWRDIALKDNNNDHHHKQRQRLDILRTCHNKLPMLMIETKKNNEEKRDLFSFSEGITYEVQLPLPCSSMFFGSSFGWLFTREKETRAITLLNPFIIYGVVPLPVFNDPDDEGWADEDYFISKGILSADPFLNPNSYEVVVIYGGMCRLAFLFPGDDSWKFINMKRDYVFSDIIYHKGQVYAVNDWSELVQIETATGIHRIVTKRSNVCAQVAYLVESQEGDLLLVQRFWESIDKDSMKCKTFEFKVFMLVHPLGESHATWVQIKSIGHQALFLGNNHSRSVSTLEFLGCQSNCIYYTDQNHLHVHPYICYRPEDDDSGVFNMEDGSFRSLDIFQKHTLPPIWFVPNLKGT